MKRDIMEVLFTEVISKVPEYIQAYTDSNLQKGTILINASKLEDIKPALHLLETSTGSREFITPYLCKPTEYHSIQVDKVHIAQTYFELNVKVWITFDIMAPAALINL